jgi:hypothetical protein
MGDKSMIKDRAPKTVRINNTNYRIGYLPADQALDVFHRLAELFLPVMRELSQPSATEDAQTFGALEQGFLRYMRGGADTEAVVLQTTRRLIRSGARTLLAR